RGGDPRRGALTELPGDRREDLGADQQLGGREQPLGEVLVAGLERRLGLVELVGGIAQELGALRDRAAGLGRRSRGRGRRRGWLAGRAWLVVARGRLRLSGSRRVVGGGGAGHDRDRSHPYRDCPELHRRYCTRRGAVEIISSRFRNLFSPPTQEAIE